LVASYTLLILVLVFPLLLVLLPSIWKKAHEIHWKATKRTLWYVRGIVQIEIHKSSRGTLLLVGFTDLDWVDDPDDRNSIAGYVFSLGLGPVTWAYKKQHAISLSSIEVECREKFNATTFDPIRVWIPVATFNYPMV
jgi:hypothetical protein